MGTPDARAALAANLRRERGRRGWSQEKLAFVAGLDRSYVSAIERGERNVGLDNLARLADALGVPLGELLVLSGERP